MSNRDLIDTLTHRHENLTDAVAGIQVRLRALELRLRQAEEDNAKLRQSFSGHDHSAEFDVLTERIAALESAAAITEQERAFLDAAARLWGSIPPVTRPSSWLMYELWRSAVPHPRGAPYQGRQAKLIERTVVPNPENSYFSLPATYLHLEGYPTGYHWLVKANGETIVALAVNEGPPDPMKVKR